jgi:hypothetical protein
MWHDPHAIVFEDDSCSSQKSVFPRRILASVSSFPGGTGTLGSLCGPGDAGDAADAALETHARETATRSERRTI